MDLGLQNVGSRRRKKWVRENRPEKDVACIPEDDWETDRGPDGNPGVCLGIAHHLFRRLLDSGVTGQRLLEKRWLLRRYMSA
jgi:hypothetical protein